MIQQQRLGNRTMIFGLCAAILTLSACAEDATYLTGKREDVRSILQDPALSAPIEGSVVSENRSQAISLSGQQSKADWTHSTGTAKYRVSNAALRGAPVLAWSADIGDGDSRRLRITADPVVSGGQVFTLDAGAQVVATSTSGAPLWSRDLTPAADKQGQGTGGGLAVEGGTVYVSIGFGVMAALDASTGAVRWSQDLDASGSGTPTVYGDLVYVTAGDSTGWALNKSNGRIEWQTEGTRSGSNVLGAPAPAINDSLALFAFGSGEVLATFRQGGLTRWRSSVVGKRPGRALSSINDVTSAPVISGDKVYVGNQSGRLMALNVGSGDTIWTAREGAIGPVWPAGGSVFVVSDLNELLRLDASTGQRIWGTPLPNFVKTKPRRQSGIVGHHGPVIAGGRVLIASTDGVIRSFDPTNGALIGTVEIPGGATTAPVVAGGTLYVVSTKGQLHAFR
jgi:outer membrane protein assembly factor BamB